MNVNISGGTITTTIAGYQSGTLVGISGGQSSLSGLPMYFAGHTPSVVNGSGIFNIKSGAAILHTVTLNSVLATAGSVVNIRNSMSGATGNIIAALTQQNGGNNNESRLLLAGTFVYDCLMTSGIVIDTVNTTWNLTVNWRDA